MEWKDSHSDKENNSSFYEEGEVIFPFFFLVHLQVSNFG